MVLSLEIISHNSFIFEFSWNTIFIIIFADFLRSEEGKGFTGQVCLVADSIGSILAYDALCRITKLQSRHGSENSILDNELAHKGKYLMMFVSY